MAALIMVMGMAGTSMAAVNIDIGIDLPILRFNGPPDVVVVPSGDSYVYMVPNTPGLYFYDGYWYRVYEDQWFRSRVYNGRWTYIESDIVPELVVTVPPEYSLYLPPSYLRVRYGNFNRNWKSWGRDRHWHGQDWFRNERRDDIRRGRMDHINRERETRRLHRDNRIDDRRSDRDRDRKRDDFRRDKDLDRKVEKDRRTDFKEKKLDEKRGTERRDDTIKDLNKQLHKGPQG
jgi:hypothetical protein